MLLVITRAVENSRAMSISIKKYLKQKKINNNNHILYKNLNN